MDSPNKCMYEEVDGLILAAMATRLSWPIFLRGIVWAGTLFLALFIPIALTVWTKSFWVLLLWPVLVALWWKYGRIQVVFDPKKRCPTCSQPLELVERDEGDRVSFYLVCSHCHKEKPAYHIPLSGEGG